MQDLHVVVHAPGRGVGHVDEHHRQERARRGADHLIHMYLFRII